MIEFDILSSDVSNLFIHLVGLIRVQCWKTALYQYRLGTLTSVQSQKILHNFYLLAEHSSID